MFKLQTNPKFTHIVPVMVPVDGGHKEEEKLTVRYRVLDSQEADRFNLKLSEDNIAFLNAVVDEITDIVDDDDNPMPWNHALRDRLFGIYYVRIALVNGYIAAVMKSRLGN